MIYLVDDNKAEFTKALYEDLAKPTQEATSGEISVTLMDIINVVKNVLPSQVANTA